MADSKQRGFAAKSETRTTDTVVLDYDLLLAAAKRLCAEAGIALPDGEWTLLVNDLTSKFNSERARLERIVLTTGDHFEPKPPTAAGDRQPDPDVSAARMQGEAKMLEENIKGATADTAMFIAIDRAVNSLKAALDKARVAGLRHKILLCDDDRGILDIEISRRMSRPWAD
jgi:hypothetical protein